MGCGLSKVDTELVTLCRERKELIKVSRDSLNSLDLAHTECFRSLQNVENELRSFVGETLVICSSSPLDTGYCRQIADEFCLSKDSSLECRDDNNNNDVISLADYVHGGSDSSEPQSENSSGHALDPNAHTVETSSEEVPTRVLEQPQVLSKEIPAFTAQPQNRKPDVSVTLPPGSSTFPQWGNGQFFQSDNFVHPPRNVIYDSAYNIPDTSGFSNYGSMKSSYDYSYLPLNSFGPYQNETAISYGSGPNFMSNFRFNLDANGASFGGQTDSPVINSHLFQHKSSIENSYMMDYPLNNAMRYQTCNHVGRPSSPPHPEAPTWDYINPFNSLVDAFPNLYFQGSYNNNLGGDNMDLSEVREREGIPDLEDELDDPIMEDTSGEEYLKPNEDLEKCHLEKAAGKNENGVCPEEGKEMKNIAGEVTNIGNQIKDEIGKKDLGSRSNSSASESLKHEKMEKIETCKGGEESKGKEMEKSETHEKLHPSSQTDEIVAEVTSDTLVHSSRNLQEVLNEIQDAFDTIIIHGKHVSETLEPYHPVVALIKESSGASSKAASALRLRLRFRFGMSKRQAYRKLKKVNDHSEDRETETSTNSCSISLALAKLYNWENKLYKEVKDEEKLRKKYDKAWRKLKKLSDRGADPMELAACGLSLRRLTPRIGVAMSKVKDIARRTHKIRDEELQPLLCELIRRLHKMWKLSFESYTKQVQAIVKAQANVEIMCMTSDSSLIATQKLETEVQKLGTTFINWIKSFKAFIVLLKKWLVKCLRQEQEEIPDANPSCSSNSLSMPIVFVICNDWLNAVEKVSDLNVSEALNNLLVVLYWLRQNLYVERHHRLKVEYLSSYHEKKLKKFCMKNGVLEQDASFFKEYDSTYAIETENTSLGALYAYLRPIRNKIQEETVKHEEGVKQVNVAAAEILRSGFLPALESLANFSREMSNAYEQVRIPDEGSTQ